MFILGPVADNLGELEVRSSLLTLASGKPWAGDSSFLGLEADSLLQEAWRTNLDEVLDLPAVRQHENGWTVDVWIVEHGRTTRYACQLTTGSGGLPPSLTVIDSIRWPGTPP